MIRDLLNKGTVVITQDKLNNSFTVHMIKNDLCIQQSSKFDMCDCVEFLEELEGTYDRVLFDMEIGARNIIITRTNNIGVDYKVITPTGVKEIESEVGYIESGNMTLISSIIDFYGFKKITV